MKYWYFIWFAMLIGCNIYLQYTLQRTWKYYRTESDSTEETFKFLNYTMYRRGCFDGLGYDNFPLDSNDSYEQTEKQKEANIKCLLLSDRYKYM